MRLIAVLIMGILLTSPVFAQVETPKPDAKVVVTTTTLKYEGVFMREQAEGPDVFWIIRTSSGITGVPKTSIVKVEYADATQAPAPVSTTPPVTVAPTSGFDLRLHGSNTVGARLAPELAQSFAAKNGLTSSVVKQGGTPEEFDHEYSKAESDKKMLFRFKAFGSGTAFQNLTAGVADIGMSSRPVNDKEVAAAISAGLGDLREPGAENVIALDGLVVVVNPGNGVQALTMDQISRIFAGEIKNWSEVGGPNNPITLYARDDKSGTFDTFKGLVLDPFKRKLAKEAKRFESSEDLSDGVSADANGIGFIGFAYVRSAKPLTVGTSCDLRYVADPFGVKTEEYPLSRRLYFYTPKNRVTEQTRAFVTHVLSSDAQPAVEAAKFISLGIEKSSERYVLDRGQISRVRPDSLSGSGMRLLFDFADRIKNATRLSVTFRFETASSRLDTRALEDVKRLAEYLKESKDTGRLMLLGFADTRGNFDENKRLSAARAQEVADALAQNGVTLSKAQIYGFGVVAPVACSDSDQALQKNRRVEIWVRQ